MVAVGTCPSTRCQCSQQGPPRQQLIQLAQLLQQKLPTEMHLPCHDRSRVDNCRSKWHHNPAGWNCNSANTQDQLPSSLEIPLGLENICRSTAPHSAPGRHCKPLPRLLHDHRMVWHRTPQCHTNRRGSEDCICSTQLDGTRPHTQDTTVQSVQTHTSRSHVEDDSACSGYNCVQCLARMVWVWHRRRHHRETRKGNFPSTQGQHQCTQACKGGSTAARPSPFLGDKC